MRPPRLETTDDVNGHASGPWYPIGVETVEQMLGDAFVRNPDGTVADVVLLLSGAIVRGAPGWCYRLADDVGANR